MSPARPKAAICRANTTSNPMSLLSAVTTAMSFVSPKAGSGLSSPAGLRNTLARSCASVELPPLPNASSRPPAANAAAISWAQATIRSRSASSTVRRKAMISCALSTVD